MIRLSPSKINTFFKCRRLYYYNYVLNIKSPFNIHLYKGSFIHKTIENLFAFTKKIDMDAYINERMLKYNPPEYLFTDEDDRKFHEQDTRNILHSFVTYIETKLNMVLSEGKVKDENHAWNYIKPRLREHKILDKHLNVLGIIDSVQKNFDGEIYIIDYKTSKLYQNTISGDYVRQLKFYAYLYYSEFGKFPDYVGVHYLRYGEVYFIPIKLINDNILTSVEEDVKHVRENTVSQNIEDYPECDNDWCDCHKIKESLENESHQDA